MDNTLRKAAEMALEALLTCDVGYDYDENPYNTFDAEDVSEAIEALRQALAQPEPEPLEYWNAVEGWVKIDEVRQHFDSVGCGTIYKNAGEGRKPLYTAPPSKPQEIDVGIDVTELGTHLVVRCGNEIIKSEFYHAPKREWVSLTDEEIDYIWGVTPPDYENFFEFPRAIEAKLKEKNT